MAEDVQNSSLPALTSSRKVNHDKIESIDQDVEVALKNILQELQDMRESYEDGIFLLQSLNFPIFTSKDIEKSLEKLIEGMKKHISLQESLFKSAEDSISFAPTSYVCLKYENGDDAELVEYSNHKVKVKVESEEAIETEDFKICPPFDSEYIEDIKLEAPDPAENIIEPTVKRKKKNTVKVMLKCEQCFKEFCAPWRLKNHMKTHEERSFKCEICDKKFKQPSSLKKHEERHTRVKSYKCEFCFKGFNSSSSLYYHLKIHTGEKAHGCDVCGSKFITPARLKEHQRTHTGEKPFTCEDCGYKCATNKLLSRHKKSHLGIKNFACHVCEKAFVRSDHLKQHIGQMHTKLK